MSVAQAPCTPAAPAAHSVLAGSIAHLNTYLHTGCRRAGALAAVCLTALAGDHSLDVELSTACRALAETLDDLPA